jgi:hypothetical protein
MNPIHANLFLMQCLLFVLNKVNSSFEGAIPLIQNITLII